MRSLPIMQLAELVQTEVFYLGTVNSDLDLVVAVTNNNGVFTEGGIASITYADFTLVVTTPAFKDPTALLLWAYAAYVAFQAECDSQF